MILPAFTLTVLLTIGRELLQGTPFFPRDLEQPLKLRQIDSKRFESGAVYLAYEAV